MSDDEDAQTIVDACMAALKKIAASHGDELIETIGDDDLEDPALAKVTAAMLAVCANEINRQIGTLGAALILLETSHGLIHRGMEEEERAREAKENISDDGDPEGWRQNKARQGRRKTQH